MYPGVVASIVCPACGQPFLCQQQAAEGMVSCPHCAHHGLRAQFATQGQTASLANVRRRVSRPLLEDPPPMHPAQAPATPPVYTPQMQPTPVTAPMQAHQPAQPVYAPAWTPPEPVVWRQPAAQTPVAMQPVQTYSEVAQEANFVPQHLQSSPGKRIGLAAIVLAVLAAGGWVWWDAARMSSASVPPAAAPSPVSTDAPEVRKAEIATLGESGAAVQPPPDVAAITKDAKRLIGDLFAADTPEKRLACIHDGARHTAQIEALLGPDNAQRPTLRMLALVKGLSLALPGGQSLPLFHLSTSTCTQGALVRLIESPDGTRRISWPLLFETHQQTLTTALQDRPDEPVWSWARLVPSHGFDIPAAERERFIAFEMHVTADAKTPLTACVERDTPLGRFLDRETDWRQSYLARLLVRKLDLGSSSNVVVIVDCEGTPAVDARVRAP